ncbi:MAG: hypothetical protein OXR68_06900 [Alphaproteobacteria bacterium]|nr:hypothetical protein [Alphaproteobacteria bacterium]MDD9920332.1 hypothetical protein [Alphaproteobacteria bacterium]
MNTQRTILTNEPILSGQLKYRTDVPGAKQRKALEKRGIGVMGLALDEMILTGAMVGSAGLFAAVSVPWDSVLMPEKARIMDELTAIEEANSNFHLRYKKWPHEMTDGSGAHNAAALVTTRAMRFPYSNMSQFKAPLKDVPFDMKGKRISLRHGYGSGGRILQQPSDNPAYRMKVTFENMPLSKVREMDIVIDQESNLDRGRLQVDVRNGRVDMVFYANSTLTASRY